MKGLPTGWVWSTVSELADLADGPFGSNLKTAHYTETGPRVVRLQNVGDGVFRDERAHISEDHYERLKKHAVRPGDIVVASLGDRVPRACLVPQPLGPAIVKADCIRVRPHAGIHPAFLMWLLNAPSSRRQAAASITGVGRPRLGLKSLGALAVPTPPSSEQRRIVAAIEEQFSRLEAAEPAVKQAKTRTSLLRTAALFSALDHVKSIQSVPLSELLETTVGGVWGQPPGHGEVDVWAFRVTEFRDDGVIDPSTAARRSITNAQLRSRQLRSGDLLIEKSGGGPDRPVGRVALVPQHDGPAVCSNFVQLVRADRDRVLPEYLWRWLQRRYRDGSAAQFQRATTNIRNLRTADYLALPVPVPRLQDQARVVAQIEQEMTVVDAIERGIDLAERRGRALWRSILDRAFCGELVLQDPSDEPAAALLERIRTERAARGRARPRRRPKGAASAT
jgi:type I restriction enzyme S subunit